VKRTHDYVHFYRGYWSRGGKCRIRIYQEDGRAPVVICSQLSDNHNTSVTNMAEYLAAEVIEEHSLPTPLTWIEHYPEHEGETGEYSLVKFSQRLLLARDARGVWQMANRLPPLRVVDKAGSLAAHPRSIGRRDVTGIGDQITVTDAVGLLLVSSSIESSEFAQKQGYRTVEIASYTKSF
jgi:hypothetical protein